VKLRVRIANKDDRMLTFIWANDPLNRRMSLKDGLSTPDTHMRFFFAELNDGESLYLIIEGLDKETWTPIGKARFYKDGMMSVMLDKNYRGRHLASPAISEVIDFARKTFPVDTVIAKILSVNTPSIKAFKKAGFVFAGEDVCGGKPCVRYKRIFK